MGHSPVHLKLIIDFFRKFLSNRNLPRTLSHTCLYLRGYSVRNTNRQGLARFSKDKKCCCETVKLGVSLLECWKKYSYLINQISFYLTACVCNYVFTCKLSLSHYWISCSNLFLPPSNSNVQFPQIANGVYNHASHSC